MQAANVLNHSFLLIQVFGCKRLKAMLMGLSEKGKSDGENGQGQEVEDQRKRDIIKEITQENGQELHPLLLVELFYQPPGSCSK